MTSKLRMGIALITFILTGGGYLVSQMAAIQGNHASVALQMDQTPIRVLAALILGGALFMAFIPDSDQGEDIS